MNITDRSTIFYAYGGDYCQPNGDPYTGAQRYDAETERILVSDKRIKRFIRDFLAEKGENIFVFNDGELFDGEKGSGCAARIKQLGKKFSFDNIDKILLNCIDVRAFGGFSTLKDAEIKKKKLEGGSKKFSGPIQFGILNSSLNKVKELITIQNTTVFPSGEDKEQGSFGTTYVAQTAIPLIVGTIDPKTAKNTGLTEEDVLTIEKALYLSVSNKSSCSKSAMQSVFLFEIIHKNPEYMIYNPRKLISLKNQDIHSYSEAEFNFSEIQKEIDKGTIKKIRYIIESEEIESQFLDSIATKDILEKIQLF